MKYTGSHSILVTEIQYFEIKRVQKLHNEKPEVRNFVCLRTKTLLLNPPLHTLKKSTISLERRYTMGHMWDSTLLGKLTRGTKVTCKVSSDGRVRPPWSLPWSRCGEGGLAPSRWESCAGAWNHECKWAVLWNLKGACGQSLYGPQICILKPKPQSDDIWRWGLLGD